MNHSFRLPVILFGAVIMVMQSQIATALTPIEIAEKAKQITVRIDGPDESSSGSGVIIYRQGNIYDVITNAHVIRKKGNYTISAPDGKQYTINHSQVKVLPAEDDLDFAVLQFTSNQSYQVAEKGDSDQIKYGTNVYAAGFPLPGPTVKQRIYRFLSGSLSGRLPRSKSGYELVYEVAALPGMSGGPILNEQGQVVGINGQAIPDARTGAVSVAGIPINIYSRAGLSLAAEAASLAEFEYYDLALPRAQMAAQLAPGNDKILWLLGGLYLQKKQYNEALVALKKAESIKPGTAYVQFSIGVVKYEQGDVEGAIKQWQSATNVDNKAAKPLLALAVALYVKGQKQQGLVLGRQALLINNRDRDLRNLTENIWGKRLLADTKEFLKNI